MLSRYLQLSDYPTVAHAVRGRAQRYPNDVAIEKPGQLGADWTKVSALTLASEITRLAKGLLAMGIEKGEKIAIMGATSYNWTIVDLAAQLVGIVVVPIYETDSPEQIEWIIRDGEIVLVVTDDPVQQRIIDSIVAKPGLAEQVKKVLSFADSGLESILEAGLRIDDATVEKRVKEVKRHDLATIIYTSGTTGRPKGVELTYDNFLQPMETVMYDSWRQWVTDPGARVLLFLPLAHVLARFISYQMLVGRGQVGYVAGVSNLLNDLAAFKPNALLVVPRVLEKIYNAADAKAGSGIKLRIFRWCARVAETWGYLVQEGRTPSRSLRIKIKIARRLVLDKITGLMGGNVSGIVSGGAPLAGRLGCFFTGCGIEILEGYGATETTGPLCMSRRENNRTGTVGPALSCNLVRLSEEGEIQAKGASIMRGYHNNPEQTAAAFTDDGWFKTGDIGRFDSEGRLRITGRIKEIIVTAGGKNVAPAVLEEGLKGHPLISQVLAVGDKQPFISALITIDKDMLPTWLKNHGLANMDVSRAIRHPEVIEAINRAILRTNKAVSRAESIRRFRLLNGDFTLANGLLTPSLKIKREPIAKKYAREIAELYQGDTRNCHDVQDKTDK